MPKSHVPGRRSFRLIFHVLCCVGWVCSAAIAQQNPAPSALPNDSKEIMRMAAKVNGISADEVGPWRLKASFTLHNAMGDVIDRGTFEEAWAGEKRNRFTFTSAGFTQTTFVTPRGWRNLGSHAFLPQLLAEVRHGFVLPLIEPKFLDGWKLTKRPAAAGAQNLICILTEDPEMNPMQRQLSRTTFCFDTRSLVLRASICPPDMQTVHNDIFQFHGRFVPRELTVRSPERIYLQAHLESLESVPFIDQAELSPPKSAFEMPEEYVNCISQVDAKRLRMGTAKPEYPPAARSANVTGTVDVLTLIDTSGHVFEAIPLSGPALLQDAAADAVRKYTFTPGNRWPLCTLFAVDFQPSKNAAAGSPTSAKP